MNTSEPAELPKTAVIAEPPATLGISVISDTLAVTMWSHNILTYYAGSHS